MGTAKICIVLVCFVIAGRSWGIDSYTLGYGTGKEKVIRIATKEIGVVERSGKNDGARIAAYLAYVGFKTPQPWCAAFVSYCFGQAGYPQPRTAWSPSLFPSSRLIKEPKPGCVFGLFYPSLKRIGHCGIITRLQGNNLWTVEGNTSVAGSRDGDGVHSRVRHKRSIRYYADWIK